MSPGEMLGRLRRALRYQRALRYRRRFPGVTFVGVTGSSGKSTTVRLAAAVLGAAGRCVQSPTRNGLRDLIGTLRELRPGDRYCVTEIAAARPGSLVKHVQLLRPDIAVITVIGREHYKEFRGVEAVAAEKARLVLAPPHDGWAVLNRDDPQVRAIGENTTRRVLWFGRDADAALRLVSARSRWPEPLTLEVAWEGRQHTVRTGLHGEHLAVPVLAALGTGLAAGVPLADAIAAVAGVTPVEGRMQPVDTPDGVSWIRDDWKAPGWSFALAFDVLRTASARRKVAVIGTISDTSGDGSGNYRRFARIAREAADLVVFVGPRAHSGLRARATPDDGSIVAFASAAEAAPWLRSALRPGDLVLLKGSHKADHLGRLLLDREAPVTCWVARCDREMFCSRCPQLRAPQDAGAAAS